LIMYYVLLFIAIYFPHEFTDGTVSVWSRAVNDHDYSVHELASRFQI
jgi:hypothetical protein